MTQPDVRQSLARSDWLHTRLAEAGDRRAEALSTYDQAMADIERLVKDADELRLFSKLEMARLAKVDPKTIYKLLDRPDS